MVRQYLDKITWESPIDDTQYDSEGNPIPGQVEKFLNDKCRYENFMKGGNRQHFRNRNGEDVLATGTLFLKKGTLAPKRFDIVEFESVRDGVSTKMRLECLNVYHGQLNITIHTVENVGN